MHHGIINSVKHNVGHVHEEYGMEHCIEDINASFNCTLEQVVSDKCIQICIPQLHLKSFGNFKICQYINSTCKASLNEIKSFGC